MLLLFALLVGFTDIGSKTLAANVVSNISLTKNHGVQLRHTVPMIIHGVTPLPKCWNHGIDLFLLEGKNGSSVDLDYFVDPVQLCSAMPDTFQQILALEIATCQMADVGKALYEDENLREACDGNLNPQTISTCLKGLTSPGAFTYLQYTIYVQLLCIRLTQHRMLEYQKLEHNHISSQYANLSKENSHYMKKLKEFFQTYDMQLAEAMELTHLTEERLLSLEETIKAALKEEISKQVPESIKQGIMNSAKVLEEQVNKTDNMFFDFIMSHINKIYDHRDRAEALYFTQLEKMTNSFNNYSSAINNYTRVTSETLSPIRNAAKFYQWLQYLPMAQELFAFGFYYYIKNKWTKTLAYLSFPIFRPVMKNLCYLEMLAEVMLFALNQYNILSIADRKAFVDVIRKKSWLFELFVGVGGTTAICTFYTFKSVSNLWTTRRAKKKAFDQQQLKSSNDGSNKSPNHPQTLNQQQTKPLNVGKHNFFAPTDRVASENRMQPSFSDENEWSIDSITTSDDDEFLQHAAGCDKEINDIRVKQEIDTRSEPSIESSTKLSFTKKRMNRSGIRYRKQIKKET